jgi:hypothetical protein
MLEENLHLPVNAKNAMKGAGNKGATIPRRKLR